MDIPGPLLVVGIGTTIFAVLWFLWRRRQSLSRFVATNELERLLIEHVGSNDSSPALLQMLSTGELLAIESLDNPEVPITFSALFPPEMGENLGEYPLNAEGQIEFGPYVICFSSQRVLKGLTMDEITKPIVTHLGCIRSYPARQVFQSALDRKCELVLNPFFGVSRRFTLNEIEAVLSAI